MNTRSSEVVWGCTLAGLRKQEAARPGWRVKDALGTKPTLRAGWLWYSLAASFAREIKGVADALGAGGPKQVERIDAVEGVEA